MKTTTQAILSFAAILSIMAVFSGENAAVAQPVFPTSSKATVSDTAGATLLLPYFEVDLTNPTGMDTIFSINDMGVTAYNGVNPFVTGSTAVLGHVIIWTDLGVPVFTFNVYLTGYDIQLVDLRSVLNGTLPATASAGQDPMDTISPK